MDHKLATGACLLLLLAAMTPGAMGHDERYFFGGGDQGVSGRYIGAIGPALASEVDYPSTIASGEMLCDLEVAGDGTTHVPQDEIHIDDGWDVVAGAPHPHPAPSFFSGMVPDSLDDGGYGGACHVRTYLHEDYNTPGCPAALASAANDAPGGPFIGAACDWKTIGGTPSPALIAECMAWAARTGQPFSIPNCLTNSVTCVGHPPSCLTGGTESCGSDGHPDGINYGHGLEGVAYPTASAHQGDAFPDLDFDRDGTPDGECMPEHARALVFVFDAVNTDANGFPHVHPALVGEIWQDAPPYLPVCDGPMIVAGQARSCIGVCTAPSYTTHAVKTSPGTGSITTWISGCANGDSMIFSTNPGFPE